MPPEYTNTVFKKTVDVSKILKLSQTYLARVAIILLTMLSFFGEAYSRIPVFDHFQGTCRQDAEKHPNTLKVELSNQEFLDVNHKGDTIKLPIADFIEQIRYQLETWSAQPPILFSDESTPLCAGVYNEDDLSKSSIFFQRHGSLPNNGFIKNDHILFEKHFLAKLYTEDQKGFIDKDVALTLITSHELSHSLQWRWGIFNKYFKINPPHFPAPNKRWEQGPVEDHTTDSFSELGGNLFFNKRQIMAAYKERIHKALEASELHADCLSGYFLQLHVLGKKRPAFRKSKLFETVTRLDAFIADLNSPAKNRSHGHQHAAPSGASSRLLSVSARHLALKQGIRAAKKDISRLKRKRQRRILSPSNVIDACSSYHM